jgi:O-antigen/teichoic acid export membrane protein
MTAIGTKTVLGFATAVMTARWLGPAGKGTLSSLLFLAAILTYVSSLGLGDAAVVLTKGRMEDLRIAAGSTIPFILCVSILASATFWIVGDIADWKITHSLIAASVLLPLLTLAYVVTAFHNAQEHLVLTSRAIIITSVLEAVGLIVLIGILGLGILGGVLAAIAGAIGGLLVMLPSLARAGVSLRPRIDASYLRRAFRFGVVNESAYLLLALTQRLDMLLVYAIGGEAPAGRYAVSLSLSQVTLYAAGAVVFASYPRLASLSAEESLRLTTRLARLNGTATLLICIPVAAVIPVVIHFFFGPAYVAAIPATLILLLSAYPSSLQWLLCRSASARGRPWIYFRSFGATLILMVVLDSILVPRVGTTGAAIGFVLATLAGLMIVLVWYRRHEGLKLRDLLPRMGDVAELAARVRSLTKAKVVR